MKYKNIPSAIHNLGHSFTSLMNYVDDGYVIDDLADIHRQGHDIEIDWMRGAFHPKRMETGRIRSSIEYYADTLASHFSSQDVDFDRIASLSFCWPAGKRKYMLAVDDRGRKHRIYVRAIK